MIAASHSFGDGDQEDEFPSFSVPGAFRFVISLLEDELPLSESLPLVLLELLLLLLPLSESLPLVLLELLLLELLLVLVLVELLEPPRPPPLLLLPLESLELDDDSVDELEFSVVSEEDDNFLLLRNRFCFLFLRNVRDTLFGGTAGVGIRRRLTRCVLGSRNSTVLSADRRCLFVAVDEARPKKVPVHPLSSFR